MTIKRKILSWAIVTLIALPVFMVFNNNAETSYINLIGLAYAFLMARWGGRIIPNWVRECLKPATEEGEDHFD